MALVQSAWALGQKQAPVSREAGGVVCERYTFTVTSNLANGDIIELGILPAYHTVVDAVLVVDEAGTATYDVGIMSGVVGDPSSSRTCGNEFFAGAADAGDFLAGAPGLAGLADAVPAAAVDLSILRNSLLNASVMTSGSGTRCASPITVSPAMPL